MVPIAQMCLRWLQQTGGHIEGYRRSVLASAGYRAVWGVAVELSQIAVERVIKFGAFIREGLAIHSCLGVVISHQLGKLIHWICLKPPWPWLPSRKVQTLNYIPKFPKFLLLGRRRLLLKILGFWNFIFVAGGVWGLCGPGAPLGFSKISNLFGKQPLTFPPTPARFEYATQLSTKLGHLHTRGWAKA